MGGRRLGARTLVLALLVAAIAMLLGACGQDGEPLAPEIGRASLEERRVTCALERSARADAEYARYRMDGRACNGDEGCLAAEAALHHQILEEIRLDYIRCRRGGL